MRTTKAISTISYNSAEFLELKLNELIRSKIISFWAFVPHKPEDDEAGNKPHKHLYIEPAKRIQTDDLRDVLTELDINHPTNKPLKCLSFRSSKFDDWFLYSMHDRAYLASKGQSRKFSYLLSDFITSDDDELVFLVKSIDQTALNVYKRMEDAISKGLNFVEFAKLVTVPVQQIYSWQHTYELIAENRTNRNSRDTHTPLEDVESFSVDVSELILNEETGELVTSAKNDNNEPLWCGGTHDQWAELYESADNGG